MSWMRATATPGLMLGLSLVLAGCSLPKPDAKGEALARSVYDQVRHGDDAAVEQEMIPQLRGPDLKAGLAQARAYIPPGEPKSVTLRGWNINAQIGQGDTSTYVFLYDYGDRAVSSEVALFRVSSGNPWLVKGFHVNAVTPAAAPQAPPPAVGGSSSPPEPPTPPAPEPPPEPKKAP